MCKGIIQYLVAFSVTWNEYCFSFSNDSTIIGDIRLIKIQFLDPGTYYLDHATVNGSDYICSSVSSVDALVLNKIEIFPNPSSGIVNINDLNGDFSLLSVSNINGFIIQTCSIESLENVTVDINSIEDGIYFLHFANEKGIIVTKKLIKN